MPISRLLDETSRPDLRTVWGRLLAHSVAADVAVTRIRLSTLDFGEAELARVRRIRVLVAELSAAALEAEVEAVRSRPEMAAALERLLRLLEAGRIAVRSAPLGGWSPDFSVFHGGGAYGWGSPRLALVGPHRFDPPGALQGPLFISAHGRSAAARAATRFDALWSRGHDVATPVAGVLLRARREPAQGRGRRGKPLRCKGFR